MIAEGTQKLNLQNQILQQNYKIKRSLLQGVDHKIIVNHINESNDALVNIYKKQVRNTTDQQTSSNIMKIKNILYPTQVFNNESVLNIENFNEQKYRELSLMNIMQDIILNQVSKLIQVQNQIDVFTKKLIQIKPGVTIIQYINIFITLKTHQAMFNSLYTTFSNSPLQQQRNKIMLRPLLNKAKSVLQTLRFQLSQDQVLNTLFDQNLEPIISKLQTVKQSQVKQIKKIRTKNEAIFQKDEYGKNFRNYLLTMIAKKKQTKIQQGFFSAKPPVVYSQLVKDALKDQITTVQKQIKQDL